MNNTNDLSKEVKVDDRYQLLHFFADSLEPWWANTLITIDRTVSFGMGSTAGQRTAAIQKRVHMTGYIYFCVHLLFENCSRQTLF